MLLQRRLERQKKGTHHVDENLTLKAIEDQLQIYRLAALYLHQNGINVYIREHMDGALLKITDTD